MGKLYRIVQFYKIGGNMKKAYLLGYWQGNVGDDLFLKIICEKYPKTKFYISTNNEYKEYYKFNNLKVYVEDKGFLASLNKMMKFFKLPNIFSLIPLLFSNIIEIGGSIFIEDDNWKKTLRRRNLYLKYSKTYNIIGCNFGPYKDNDFLSYYREFFNGVDDICFRDLYSYNLFKDNEKARYAPDIVFSLANKVDASSVSTNEVVISIIDLMYETRNSKLKNSVEQYELKIVEVIKDLLRDEKIPTLVSFCEHENDSNAVERILNRFDTETKKKIKVVMYEDINQILDIFSRAERVIATRYHAMILGIKFHKMISVLSYSKKIDRVIEDLKIDIPNTRIQNITKNSLSGLLTYGTVSDKQINEISKKSALQFEHVDEILE